MSVNCFTDDPRGEALSRCAPLSQTLRIVAMKKPLDHGHRFPPDMIKLTVWI